VERLPTSHSKQNGWKWTKKPKLIFIFRFAWVQDKFGLSWQINFDGNHPVQTIEPYIMFVGDVFGKCSEAMALYLSIFHDSKEIMRVNAPDNGKEDAVRTAKILLQGQEFMIAESGADHKWSFSKASSFLIQCKDQTEIDYFWEKLSHQGTEDQCGWCRDKFGVTWQVVPSSLKMMLTHPEKGKKVFLEMRTMKKIDLPTLEKAFNS
jgi:predicted 3-demethylubiquinone-9 3-methyltransferase (glyoxalase superfamily)